MGDTQPDDTSSPYSQVLRYEAALVRVRTALREGRSHEETVGDDIEMIRMNVEPSFARKARRMRGFGPEVEQEALELMTDRLLSDIFNLDYPSMETMFGAYLKTMPKQVEYTIKRKYMGGGVSSIMERLDADSEDGASLHESLSDPSLAASTLAVEWREALAEALPGLTAPERKVWTLRAQDMPNNEIAAFLNISQAKASLLFGSAVRKLKARIEGSEE